MANPSFSQGFSFSWFYFALLQNKTSSLWTYSRICFWCRLLKPYVFAYNFLQIYEDARRKAAAATQARQQAETEEALNTRISEAEAEIAARRDAALADVNAIATDAAQAIVEKLSGVAISADDARSAVSEREAARA